MDSRRAVFNNNNRDPHFSHYDAHDNLCQDPRANPPSGLVRPSFATSSVSNLPASLGLGNGLNNHALGDRPRGLPIDRRNASDGGFSPHNATFRSTDSNQDSVRFASGTYSRFTDLPSSLGSIPSWASPSTTVRRTPIPTLPASAQIVESPSVSTTSRNFLVPIGSTGARQKLSIANASQRKRLTVSDEVRWPDGPPLDPTFGKDPASIIKPNPSLRTAVSNITGLVPSSNQTQTNSFHLDRSDAESSSSTNSTSLGNASSPEPSRLLPARPLNNHPKSLGERSAALGSDTTTLPANLYIPPAPSTTAGRLASAAQQHPSSDLKLLSPVRSAIEPVPLYLKSSNGFSQNRQPLVSSVSARPTVDRSAPDSTHRDLSSSNHTPLAARTPPLSHGLVDQDVKPSAQDSKVLQSKAIAILPASLAAASQVQNASISPVDASIHDPPSQHPMISSRSSGALKEAPNKSNQHEVHLRSDPPSDSTIKAKSLGRMSSAESYKQSMLQRSAAEQPSSDPSSALDLPRSTDPPSDLIPAGLETSHETNGAAPTTEIDLQDSTFDPEEENPISHSSRARKGVSTSSSLDEGGPASTITDESDKSTGSFEGAYIHPFSTPLTSLEYLARIVSPDGLSSLNGIYSKPATSLTDGQQMAWYSTSGSATASDRHIDSSSPSLTQAPPQSPSSSEPNLDTTPKLDTQQRFEGSGSSPQSPDLSARDNRSQTESGVANGLADGFHDDPQTTPKRTRILDARQADATDIGIGSPSFSRPSLQPKSKDRPSPYQIRSPYNKSGQCNQREVAGLGSSAVDFGDTRTRDFSFPRQRDADLFGYGSPSPTPPSSVKRSAVNGSQSKELARNIHEDSEDFQVWRRNNDAYAVLSPGIQQSRFSEASTDASESYTPTRDGDHNSGMDSTEQSDGGGDDLEDDSIDGQMLPTSAWMEVENTLRRFQERSPTSATDRGNLLRAVLLPFLALEAETVSVDVIGSGPYVKGKNRRALLFDWIRFLLVELQHIQTSADRGAILESIACIIESRNFSANILGQDLDDEAKFSSVFGHILSYAIGELNKKGVYQNTLIFSGRLLAVAFFRVEGVATKLLRALPVNRFALERVAKEAEWDQKRPLDFARFCNKFPQALRQLCYKDARSYLKMLDAESVLSGGDVNPEDDRFLVRQPEAEVEMSGNWLRRWQSDDSELFFSFCRSYHRQLASLFASSKSLEGVSKSYFGGPGYAHLATCVHQKCLALVHRVILSVTTLSSQKNFNPAGETANVLSGSTTGKPRILEAANRRCTSIVVDIVRAQFGSNMIFAPMLGLHIKCLVKRTSLYDVQGVFCLLDWLDGVLNHMDQADLLNEGLVDISFVIKTIGMILEDADHALALMRTIAFCYANFGVLTSTTESRIHFCEEILLKPKVFIKLFLSWSFTIRAYFLHLLVFRLARIKDFPNPRDDPDGKTAISVVRLFNLRLEQIRKRHDGLSPDFDSTSEDTRSEDDKPKKNSVPSFVSTIKKTPSATVVEASTGRSKAERLLGIGSASESNGKSDQKGQSKTKTWLKALRGSNKNKAGQAGPTPAGNVEEMSSATAGRARMNAVEEATVDSDDDNRSFDSYLTSPRSSNDSQADSLSNASTLNGSVGRSPKGKLGGFEFEFQGKGKEGVQGGNPSSPVSHDAGIAKDTVFDLQSATAHLPGAIGKGATHSPRVSRAFSKRASMLPAPASELMGLDEFDAPPVPLNIIVKSGPIYDEALHVYAVQSLREYEQTVQEHDEFFASLPEEQSAQVPRLPVNWPAMWSSTGE